MKNKILFFLCLWACFTNAQTTVLGVDTIWKSGPINKRINLVILGDGYTNPEQTLFISDVNNVINYMFNTSPFDSYKNYFNVFAIKCESPQSGVTHQGIATDVTEPASPVMAVTNCFSTKFDNYNIHRLIYSMDASAIYSVLAQYFPSYDQALVLGNSPEYGGAGGAYAVSSTHASSKEIVLHEMGHSFAGLADEYWAGAGFATEKPNMTQDNSASNKWGQWQGINLIGAYPYGTSAPDNTWFRPHQNCRMRYLNKPFCSVCKQTIIERIHELVNPVDSFMPANSTITFTTSSQWFKINTIQPIPNTLKRNWYLNLGNVANNIDSVQIFNSMLNNGNNELTVLVNDTTSLSKDVEVHPNYHLYFVTWDINYTSSGITEISPKIEYSIFPNPASQSVSVKYTLQVESTISFVITDVNGKEVYVTKPLAQKQGEYKNDINLEALKTGTYFLTLRLNNQVLNNKFVISK